MLLVNYIWVRFISVCFVLFRVSIFGCVWLCVVLCWVVVLLYVVLTCFWFDLLLG